MERIRRFFRRLGKGLKAKGYTLVEIAAVVAVTGTLAAVVIPIAVDKVKQGKETAAKNDCIQIGVAITGFYKDTGEWPAYSLTTKDFIEVLRSGPTNASAAEPTDPQVSVAVPSRNWGKTRIDHLENHLVVDNPGGTLGIPPPNANYLDTFYLNWKGPYSESFTKRDPWGNNYLVLVNAMYQARTEPDKHYGWIISAGPNGQLETKTTDNKLCGDDIGVMLYAAEAGR